MNDEHKTTQDLITDYYLKSSRYSKSILFLAIIGVATVIVSAVWVYQSKTKIDAQQQTINSRTEAIQTQINCVGKYFTQTDRANLKIPSLDDCSIVRVQ